MNTCLCDHSLKVGIHNAASTFFFRLGYVVWVLKGANLLKPLSYYGKSMDNLSDDTETLRGAYGPRMRRWVGPDALQEAINKNQSIENEEDLVKPIGIDQLEAAFKDLESGMQETVIQIFDPALDFAETNYVPDLHRLSLVVKIDSQKRLLDVIMDYLVIDPAGHMVNDLFLVEIIKKIYCGFLGIKEGATYINIARTIHGFEGERTGMFDECKMAFTAPGQFWAEYDLFLDFEKHMRMQVNDRTFKNSEVAVAELIGLLKSKYLDTFKNELLVDLGHCLLLCAILRYSDNPQLYSEYIAGLHNAIKHPALKSECEDYAINIGSRI